MTGILYLIVFLFAGTVMSRLLLPRVRPLLRVYLGASLGLFLMLWLPALWACAVSFTVKAHILSLLTLALLVWLCRLFRENKAPVRFDETERRELIVMLAAVLPLLLIGGYLEYTHSIRLAADGSLHVGQSTYGDLSLHLAIASSAVGARFPLHNSLMSGATMAYPYLSDTFASSLYMMGLPLNAAMTVSGTVMLAFVFTGYWLLARQLCRRKHGALLAFLMLFLNGGLGIFYTLDAASDGYTVTRVWDNLRTVMTGYYQTPTNQPDPHNLRWVNIICDMLIPQRGILGGWTFLMPCLNLLVPPLCRREDPGIRRMILLGILAGGLPLIHTHSYLALVLFSAGACLYCVITAKGKEAKQSAFLPWLIYGAIAAALSLPQLFGFTFVQASESSHFLSLWFNWANNRGNHGMVDTYFWFYLKNVGLPYLLIPLALLRRRPKGAPAVPDDLRQYRLIACGAFLIYAAAELVKFQPNEYDNNKLLYVWFLLCLPMAADYLLEIFEKLRGLAGRRVLAALTAFVLFAAAGLTVARECVSDYQAYSAEDVETAEFVKANTPEHCLFLTGNQHLNPVSSLAGRTIVCSSDLYLYYHGFSTGERRAEITAFYADPAAHLDLLSKYQVEYIFVSAYEYSQGSVDETALEELFPLIHESEFGRNRIYRVPEEYRI